MPKWIGSDDSLPGTIDRWVRGESTLTQAKLGETADPC